MTIKEFINWVYPYAEQTDIDPIFVTAQAALESGWGKSSIGNNIFGITKGSSWNGAVQLVTTTEYFTSDNISLKAPEKILSINKINDSKYKYKVKRLFRDYDSVAECLKDHTKILQGKNYIDAWPYRHDRYEFIKRIQDSVGGKYATSPEYVETMNKMFKIVEKYI